MRRRDDRQLEPVLVRLAQPADHLAGLDDAVPAAPAVVRRRDLPEVLGAGQGRSAVLRRDAEHLLAPLRETPRTASGGRPIR
jgi:hypothetical protein